MQRIYHHRSLIEDHCGPTQPLAITMQTDTDKDVTKKTDVISSITLKTSHSLLESMSNDQKPDRADSKNTIIWLERTRPER